MNTNKATKKVKRPNRERQMYKCHEPLESCKLVNPIFHSGILQFSLAFYESSKRIYSGMGLVPKFIKGRRCRTQLKQNIRMKEEMSDTCKYLRFSTLRIFRLARYSLTLASPGHVHRYIVHGINEITILLL